MCLKFSKQYLYRLLLSPVRIIRLFAVVYLSMCYYFTREILKSASLEKPPYDEVVNPGGYLNEPPGFVHRPDWPGVVESGNDDGKNKHV